MDVSLPDGSVIKGVPEGTTKTELLGKLQLAKHPAAEGLMRQMASEQATADTSGFGKFLAGAGKSVSDVGLGLRQLIGNASQGEVDESKARDAALMGSGAGMAGNITGNVAQALLPGLGMAGAGKTMALPALQAVGKLALTSPATMTGALASGGLGAAQGFVQPTAIGDSRAMNTGVGLLGGATVPVAGMALKTGKGLLEPLYQGGRDAIVGRALRDAAGPNADTVIQNLKSSAPLVPGSQPTAAEVANSGGIAAMQRAASAVDPEAYATRAAQQNEARVSALESLSGSSGARQAAESARDSAAGPLYKKAYDLGIDPAGTGVRPDLMKQVEDLSQRPAIQSAINEAKTKALNEGIDLSDPTKTVKGLHYIKRSIDDQISKAARSGADDEVRVLKGLQTSLLGTVDQLSPEYGAARQTFASMSKPINQMDVAQEIADKSVNKLTGNLQPQAFAKALSDDTAVRATGFPKATLSNTFDLPQMNTLNNIKQDLTRSVAARDMGRGAGSDTVQKLAMTNLMQQAGLPVGLLNTPGLGRLGNWAFSHADAEMKQSLASGLLNPKQAAMLMEKATPSERAKIFSGLLRSATPAMIGGTTGLLNARQ